MYKIEPNKIGTYGIFKDKRLMAHNLSKEKAVKCSYGWENNNHRIEVVE